LDLPKLALSDLRSIDAKRNKKEVLKGTKPMVPEAAEGAGDFVLY
jgi:hypothetical protein